MGEDEQDVTLPARDRRALAVAASPMQIVNAFEASLALGLGPTRLLWLEPQLPADRRQGQRVMEVLGWHDVETVPADLMASALRKRLWLARLQRRLGGRVETLVLGDYRLDLMRHLAHTIAPDGVVAVDDGTGTLLAARARFEGRDLADVHLQGTRPGAGRRTLHRVAGLRTNPLSELTFFSVYDPPVRPPDRAVANRYAFVRGRFPAPAQIAETWLLGVSWVSTGMIARSRYLELATAAAQAGPVVYLPHRKEDQTLLQEIAQIDGVAVRHLDLPIELHVLSSGVRPVLARSFLSSALDTLPLICPELPFEVLQPPAELFDPSVAARLTALYDRLELPRRTLHPAVDKAG